MFRVYVDTSTQHQTLAFYPSTCRLDRGSDTLAPLSWQNAARCLAFSRERDQNSGIAAGKAAWTPPAGNRSWNCCRDYVDAVASPGKDAPVGNYELRAIACKKRVPQRARPADSANRDQRSVMSLTESWTAAPSSLSFSPMGIPLVTRPRTWYLWPGCATNVTD